MLGFLFKGFKQMVKNILVRSVFGCHPCLQKLYITFVITLP